MATTWLETFVDPARFKGTCYHAANWLALGRTTGRGKNAPSKKADTPSQRSTGAPVDAALSHVAEPVIGNEAGK